MRNKYIKKYRNLISGEGELDVNFMVFYIFSLITFFMVLGFLTVRYVKPIVINPLLFMTVAFGPAIAIGWLISKYIKFKNSRIFSDRYTFSMIYNNIDEAPVIKSHYAGEDREYAIITLGAGVIPNFPPLRGGGKDGFLVIDRKLALNFNDTIFARSVIIQTNADALPDEVKAMIINHPRYKEEKTKIYFGAMSLGETPEEFEEYLEIQKQKSLEQFYKVLDSLDAYITHLATRLSDSSSRRKELER